MTTKEKRAWLDWAVEIGLLSKSPLRGKVYWAERNNGIMAEILGSGELVVLDELEFTIRDEIDRLAFLLKQEDVIDTKGGKGFFAIVRDCNQSLGFSKSRDSRLEALMIAFKQAVETGKR